jgi:hypothetical protein
MHRICFVPDNDDDTHNDDDDDDSVQPSPVLNYVLVLHPSFFFPMALQPLWALAAFSLP